MAKRMNWEKAKREARVREHDRASVPLPKSELTERQKKRKREKRKKKVHPNSMAARKWGWK